METQILKLDSPANARKAAKQAAKVWAQGGLVVFPTETVYGVGAQVDAPNALERLAQVKQRPDDKAFTLHVPRRSDVDEYVGHLSLQNRCFVQKALPGPVTAIFELNDSAWNDVSRRLGHDLRDRLYHDRTLGIRLPDHETAIEILAAAKGPIVASSANAAGHPAPTSFDDALDALNGQVDLALDAGPTRYAKPSTVVRLGPDEIEVLREGVLDAPAIRRMRTVNILFVCTGNSCRSPMAEAFCQLALAEKLGCQIDDLPEKGFHVSSAGASAAPGMPAAPESIRVCGERGVDLHRHQAQLLTRTVLGRADIVYAMEESHLRVIRSMAGPATHASLLCPDADVDDPIGRGFAAYRVAGERIEHCIRQRLAELW